VAANSATRASLRLSLITPIGVAADVLPAPAGVPDPAVVSSEARSEEEGIPVKAVEEEDVPVVEAVESVVEEGVPGEGTPGEGTPAECSNTSAPTAVHRAYTRAAEAAVHRAHTRAAPKMTAPSPAAPTMPAPSKAAPTVAAPVCGHSGRAHA
jgi:hypothetical protein